jgi:hypothetical protein
MMKEIGGRSSYALRALSRTHRQDDDASHNECTGQNGGNALVMLRFNTDSCVSDLDIMIFGVGDGNGKRQYAQYQEYYAKQS